MSLAAVENRVLPVTEIAAIDRAVDHWQTFPASDILDHGAACCRIARVWLRRMDASLLNGEDATTGPRWIRQRFKWGPSSWPIHWCEAVEKKVLDCGALAAISRELFASRGIESYATQFIQRYTADASAHWQAKWEGDQDCLPHWIRDELIYHEGCAIVTEQGQLRVWDPTPAWWVKPRQFDGYGAVLALRVSSSGAQVLRWGDHTVRANRWEKIEAVTGGLG